MFLTDLSKLGKRKRATIRKIAGLGCFASFLGAGFFLLVAGALVFSVLGNFAQCYFASEVVFAKVKPILIVIPRDERSIMTVANAFRPIDCLAALNAVGKVYGVDSREYAHLATKVSSQRNSLRVGQRGWI